eukprot:672303-Rhodomonas_salina.1
MSVESRRNARRCDSGFSASIPSSNGSDVRIGHSPVQGVDKLPGDCYRGLTPHPLAPSPQANVSAGHRGAVTSAHGGVRYGSTGNRIASAWAHSSVRYETAGQGIARA